MGKVILELSLCKGNNSLAKWGQFCHKEIRMLVVDSNHWETSVQGNGKIWENMLRVLDMYYSIWSEFYTALIKNYQYLKYIES